MKSFRLLVPCFLALAAGGCILPARTGNAGAPACTAEGVESITREQLRGILQGSGVPGVTVAVYMPTRFQQPIAIASGWSDYMSRTPMRADSRILAGSVGKTMYAAAALRLVDMGRLDLDRTVAHYLPAANIPYDNVVTVRMLMSHTSGYGEYDGTFMEDLIANPLRVRTLDDWTGPLRRSAPDNPASFRYSDINYVLLAHVIASAAGVPAESFIRSEFLHPFKLVNTEASQSPLVSGLVQGYAGPENFFGRDAMIDSTGRLIYNPQFESGGGGFVSTAPDLARWITLFGTSTLFSIDRWREASVPVEGSERRENDTYGLGIHIYRTLLGVAYGHSGYIPGYVSWARWYEKPSVGIAIQVNTSDQARLPWDGFDLSDSIATRVASACHQ